MYHLVLGLAIGLVAIVSLMAWPFAILTGIVIGRVMADRRAGRRQQATPMQFLAVAGGVGAMFVGGFLVGALPGFLIVGLAALSERASEQASPADRTMARIIVLLTAGLVWAVGVFVLGIRFSLSFG